MDFLTPPTDNLYKFMAIGGIALFIALLFVDKADFDRLQDLGAQAAMDLASSGAKIEFQRELNGEEHKRTEAINNRSQAVDARLGEVNRQRAEIVKQAEGARGVLADKFNAQLHELDIAREAAESDAQRVIAETHAVDQRIDTIVKAAIDDSVATAALQARTKHLTIQRVALEDRSKYFNWLSAFSGLFSTLGFLLWYSKVQRFQDQIIEAEAREKREPKAPMSAVESDEMMPSI